MQLQQLRKYVCAALMLCTVINPFATASYISDRDEIWDMTIPFNMTQQRDQVKGVPSLKIDWDHPLPDRSLFYADFAQAYTQQNNIDGAVLMDSIHAFETKMNAFCDCVYDLQILHNHYVKKDDETLPPLTQMSNDSNQLNFKILASLIFDHIDSFHQSFKALNKCFVYKNDLQNGLEYCLKISSESQTILDESEKSISKYEDIILEANDVANRFQNFTQGLNSLNQLDEMQAGIPWLISMMCHVNIEQGIKKNNTNIQKASINIQKEQTAIDKIQTLIAKINPVENQIKVELNMNQSQIDKLDNIMQENVNLSQKIRTKIEQVISGEPSSSDSSDSKA